MRSDRWLRVLITCAALAVAFLPGRAFGMQDQEGLPAPSRAFALPIEVEHDYGAFNGEATIIRFLPVYTIPISSRWRLANLDLVTLADARGGAPGRPGNPTPELGDRVFGLSDLLHASFLTPEGQRTFIWGAGFMLRLPTATDESLGAGKWAFGPALRLVYRKGGWNVGGVAGQNWSFAGDPDRADLSLLLIRASLRRQLPAGWYLVSAPIINANWRAPASQTWLVPLGGGVGKRLGPPSWATSAQAYYNVVRPDGAPKWALRLQVIAAISF
ncbi:MAG: hypothetical protein OEU54_02910 [Gemmatimonadota bacterium]|nr:hypothetical protein [Gemmatimonadota bacterium]